MDLVAIGKHIGAALRANRIAHNDRQSDMAARIKVSRSTYIRMEHGDMTINLEHWIRALSVFGLESRALSLFSPEQDLFELLEQKTNEDNKIHRVRKQTS